METARNRLYETGEKLTGGYFSDMIHSALPSEYEVERNTIFRDRELTREDIMSTAKNVYVDLSRPPTAPSVVDHGVAVHVQGDLNKITCRVCK